MPAEQSNEKRWTIYACPRCGKRTGDSLFCRCAHPAVCCKEVEVIPADSPNVLSKEEARYFAGLDALPSKQVGDIEDRLFDWVEGSTDG